MALTPKDIHLRHSYQAPTPLVAELHESVNSVTEGAAQALEVLLPECREKALAHTKLEEVRFWANAAVARNHDKLG